MMRLLAAVCVCLLASPLARAEILFDLDPNVPDLLSAQITEAPVVPPGEPASLWEERAALGWDWTVITVRPTPAGRFDVSHVTLSAHSSLPTQINVDFLLENGNGGWGGPPLAVLNGEVYSFDIDWPRVTSLQFRFVSPQPGDNVLDIDIARLTGTSHIVPEPHSAATAVGALGAFGIFWLIVRQAKRRSSRDRSQTF